MAELVDDHEQQRTQETQEAPKRPEEPYVVAAASGATSKPNDAVLTSWVTSYGPVSGRPKDVVDACGTEGSQSSACAQSAASVWEAQQSQQQQKQQQVPPEKQIGAPAAKKMPVPAPFDVPVDDRCVTRPEPHDWSTVSGLPECPMKPIVGGPHYKAGFDAPILDGYKSAFNASWSEVQTGYNAIVAMNRSYRMNEKDIIPLLHVDGEVGVSAGGQNAAKSFKGAKLKPEVSKVDSQKVNAKPGLRDQLLVAKDKIGSSERAVTNQRATIEQANGQLLKACNALEQAENNIEVVKIDQQIGDAQLDKEQVRRDLEDYKADIKAVVEGAKFVSGLFGAVADPTKVFDLFNQTMNTAGAIAEKDATHDANKKIAVIEQKVRAFQHRKSGLQLKNAMKEYETRLLDIREKVLEVDKQVRLFQDRKDDYSRAYREMAGLMAQSGEVSGMRRADSRALSAAVEAMPKLEAISQELEGMESGVSVPKYNEASGVGAAMCSNLSAFTHALGVVKGNKDYIAELKALWEGRRASVQMVMDKVLSVEGTEW